MNLSILLNLLILFYLNLPHHIVDHTELSTPLIKIDLSKAKQEGISQYFTPKSCIQLEKTNSSSIKQLSKIIAYDGKLYTMSGLRLNNDGHESIKVFDQKSGLYLYDIGKEGTGPGEYYGLRDFVIDTVSNELIALVASKEALVYFNPITGAHLRDVHSGLYATEMGLLEDQIVVYNEFNATAVSDFNLLIFLDNSGQPIARKHPYFPEYEGVSFPFTGFLHPLSTETLLFSIPFADTIYAIRKDAEIEPYIHFNLGINTTSVGTFRSGNISDATFLSNTFFKTGEFFIFRYREDLRVKLGLYDLRKKELFNDLAEDSFFSVLTKASFYVTSFKAGEVTFAITPEYLSWCIAENPQLYDSYLYNFPFLLEGFETDKATDNPILVTFEVGKVK